MLPTVTVDEKAYTPSTYNDPILTRRVRKSITAWLGADAVCETPPSMVGEDFGQYGRTLDHVPVCMFWLGAVAPEKVAESKRTGEALPSLQEDKEP